MLSIKTLKQYNFFRNLSDHAIEEIAKKLDTIIIPNGTIIIKENTPPDYFYFLKSGEVEITKKTKFGQDAKITTLQAGEGFGEIALLTCSHRQNTVSAIDEVTLYRLSKKDFEDIIINETTFKNIMVHTAKSSITYNNIKTLQPFALLEPVKMIALMDKLVEKTYPKGKNIITIDEKGDNYYIIKSGKVSVLKREDRHDKNSKMVEVDTLGEGEAFGEEALIRQEPRSATVKTLEETSVLVLDKKDFNHILKSSHLGFTFPEDVFPEDWVKYVYIDARISSEYEEEHIEGAINIPLEILRKKYNELDINQEYLTYCTNDSRGMAAAFLLTAQGFKAKNLRSGLSGWEGPVVTGTDGIHFPRLDT